MSRKKVSDTEYSGAWWAGFRAAVYEQQQNLGRSNINAIALAMEGSPIEQDSYGSPQDFSQETSGSTHWMGEIEPIPTLITKSED